MAKRRVPRYKRDGDTGEVTPRPPSGRIAADLSQQAPNNSYGGVPLYYEDTPFTCVDCGKEEVWTAEQQKWWYEVAKGPIYSRAVRCRDCRRARRAERTAGTPPPKQPIRHVGTLQKRLRAEVEPALAAGGFVFDSRSTSKDWRKPIFIDFRRGDQVLSLAYGQRERCFIAEFLDASGDCRTIANLQIPQPPTARSVDDTIKVFAAAVTDFVAGLN